MEFRAAITLAMILTLTGNPTQGFTQTPQTAPMAIMPVRYRCSEIIELEVLVSSQNTITFASEQQSASLAADYKEVGGWLNGYFTGLNQFAAAAGGNITKNTTPAAFDVA